jgi:hypothetical protein
MHGHLNVKNDIKLWKKLDTMKLELCSCHLCMRTVQRAETGGGVGKLIHNPVNGWGFELQ